MVNVLRLEPMLKLRLVNRVIQYGVPFVKYEVVEACPSWGWNETYISLGNHIGSQWNIGKIGHNWHANDGSAGIQIMFYQGSEVSISTAISEQWMSQRLYLDQPLVEIWEQYYWGWHIFLWRSQDYWPGQPLNHKNEYRCPAWKIRQGSRHCNICFRITHPLSLVMNFWRTFYTSSDESYWMDLGM